MSTSEQNSKEQQVRFADDRLSRIVESARLGTWEWNIETGELVWSRECLDMFGLPHDTKMSYDRFLEAILPEDRERIDQACQFALATGNEYSTEMRAQWPDGTIHWVASRGRAYFDKTGRPVRMSGAGMDITRLKQTEEDLRRARAEAKAQADNLAAVFDAMPAAAFFSHDRNCERVTSNRAAYELLRMPYGSNTSMSAPKAERPSFIVLEKGQEVRAEELPLQKAAITGQPVRNKEFELRFPDGSSIYEFGHGVPLFDEEGQVRGAVAAFLDITDRKIIEQRLRASTERFQIALRGTPITVFNQGLDLRYTWIYNPFSGYNAVEIIGKRDIDFLERMEDAVKMEAIKSEVIRSAVPFQGEVEIYLGGQPRTYHVTIEPQRDPQNRICGLTCASFDLTDRKRGEAEVEKLARQRQMALDAAKLGWWHYDARTGVSTWDQSFAKMYGMARLSGGWEELIGRLHPEDREKAAAKFLQSMDPKDPRPYFNEYRILQADGAVCWVESHGAGEFEGEGEARVATGCSGTVQDISARKVAEQRLRQAEETLRSQWERSEFVAEGSDVGFWFCDLPFDNLIWDKRVRNHFWLPADDSSVTIEMFYSMLHADDRELTRRAIENSINNGERYDVEYRTIAPDGRQRWVRAIGRTFHDAAGKPVRFDGITQDITARKTAEEALRQSEARYRDLAAGRYRQQSSRLQKKSL